MCMYIYIYSYSLLQVSDRMRDSEPNLGTFEISNF